jgi:hypothetical protein
MEVDNVHQHFTILKLTDEEANWLNGVMQNSLHGEDEIKADQDMREKFFNATRAVALDYRSPR